MVKKKIQCVDFKQLNPSEFIYEGDKDVFLKHSMIMHTSGTLYINTRINGWKLTKVVFDILKKEETGTLEKYIEWAKKEYPGIKTIEDVFGCKKNDQVKALSMFLAPVELKRREFEKAYDKKQKTIHCYK